MKTTLFTTKEEFKGYKHASFHYGALEYYILTTQKDWRFDSSDQVYIIDADKDEINPKIKESNTVWITCTSRQNKYINLIRSKIFNIKKFNLIKFVYTIFCKKTN